MFTVCPKCALTLVVTAADLRVAQGYVRCGRCSSVFNALAQLSDERAAARDAEAAAAESEPEEPAGTPAEAAGQGQQGSAAPPAADEEDLIPDIDLEFDPATTDASSVFVAVAPSPEWTAATGSFKALVAASQEPPTPEPKPAEADEDIDIELDAALLSDIVQSEPAPAPPGIAVSAPAAPREAPPPAPRESRPAAPREAPPPAPRESRPAAPREAPPPAPRESRPAAPREAPPPARRESAPAPAAAPKPAAAPAPAPVQPQPPATQKQPTPAAPAGPPRSTAPAAATGPAAPAPESAEVQPDDPDAGTTGTSALLEAAGKPQTAARGTWAWAAGALLLALVLVAQIIDHQRDTLATDPRFSHPLTALYSALGVTLMPRWDLRSYDVRQLGATVGQGTLGAITVRASIRNSGPMPQPLPLLRVTLQDRFGNRLASRDVTPRDYLPQSVAPTAFLSRDQRIDAELAFVDPGANAVGFELDACLPMSGGIACANDTSAR